MGWFSKRRKSLVTSFAETSLQLRQDKEARQLYPLRGEGDPFYQYSPAMVPTNQPLLTARRPTSRRLQKPRPTTAQGEVPRLFPKKTNERPLSAASRALFSHGQPMSPSMKSIALRVTGKSTSLPSTIDSTPMLRSMESTHSLKLKSLDLLKSNPRLQYLSPPLNPSVSTPPKGLIFHHDGRGLFASKTVDDLADELDSHGIRKLLDRDSRRNRGYVSYNHEIVGQTPPSRGNTDYTGECGDIPDNYFYAAAGPSNLHTEIWSEFGSEERNSSETIQPSRDQHIYPIVIFGKDQEASQEQQSSPMTLSQIIDHPRNPTFPTFPLHDLVSSTPDAHHPEEHSRETCASEIPCRLSSMEQLPSWHKSSKHPSFMQRPPTPPRRSPPRSPHSNVIEFTDQDEEPFTWGESPIIGTSIPPVLPRPEFPPSPGSMDESEGTWLAGRAIENAVRKSFAGSARATPFKRYRPGSASGRQGEYDGCGDGERVRQGNMVRRVEVVDTPNFDGVVGRISLESDGYEEVEIVLM